MWPHSRVCKTQTHLSAGCPGTWWNQVEPPLMLQKRQNSVCVCVCFVFGWLLPYPGFQQWRMSRGEWGPAVRLVKCWKNKQRTGRINYLSPSTLCWRQKGQCKCIGLFLHRRRGINLSKLSRYLHPLLCESSSEESEPLSLSHLADCAYPHRTG